MFEKLVKYLIALFFTVLVVSLKVHRIRVCNKIELLYNTAYENYEYKNIAIYKIIILIFERVKKKKIFGLFKALI